MTKFFLWVKGLFASSFGEDPPTYTKCMELVERSRHGDQVAIAIISRTRKAAEGGSELARQSLAEIIRYAKATTVSQIGAEEGVRLAHAVFGKDLQVIGPQLTKVALDDPERAIVTIANSCNAKALAKALDGTIESEAFRKAFLQPRLFLEMMKEADHDTQHALLLGYVLGVATRLQMARRPDVPTVVFSRRVAWELGQ